MALKNKILLTVGIIACSTFSAMADKGTGKKSKNKVLLNIKNTPSLRSNVSFSLKSGVKLTGVQKATTSNGINFNTYQKGNTVYIVPQKATVLVPELKQGYTGLKLIITKKN